MPAFLILLPLTLTSLLIGVLIALSPQAREYVQFIADVSGTSAATPRLALQIAMHVVAYAMLCFVLVATVHTVSTPLPPERRKLLRSFQSLLEVLFVALPSLLLVWLILNAISDGQFLDTLKARNFVTVLSWGRKTDWLLWLALGAALLGLLATIRACKSSVRLELFRSSVRPLSLTLADSVGAICVVIILATFIVLLAGFLRGGVGSAQFLGAFPILFMAFAMTFLVIAAIFSAKSAPIPVLSTIVSIVVILQIVDMLAQPARQFRYKPDMPKIDAAQRQGLAGKLATSAITVDADDVRQRREILDLVAAFKQWIEHRRPIIEAYRQEKKTYPLFIVAAQGGGFYAAYHSALTLARLQDTCPEFADHVFAVSSVSGGSLGAAVFTELVRSQMTSARTPPIAPPPAAATPAPPASGQPQVTPGASAAEAQPTVPPAPPRKFCTRDSTSPKLEGYVRKFFQSDLLSPVVASTLMLDIPGLLFPPLRWGVDRAVVFELSLEAAWRNLPLAGSEKPGFSNNFYGRWKPQDPVPALFMSATGVNHGVPTLISQIYWQEYTRVVRLTTDEVQRVQSYATRRSAVNPEIRNLLEQLYANQQALGSGQVRIANILDFRPDLQLAMSTATTLSARFPYVTPPGNIEKENRVDLSSSIYKNMEVMELVDGGFYDNSGRMVAARITRILEKLLDEDASLKDLEPHIRVRLIHFTHQPAKRTGTGHERGHFELVAPLAAFDSVRVERGAHLEGRFNEAPKLMYLFDRKFDAPLSWLLSSDTRRQIELRSGGRGQDVKTDGICCYVRAPWWRFSRLIYLNADEERAFANHARLRPFIPNRGNFNDIVELIDSGDKPRDAALARAAR